MMPTSMPAIAAGIGRLDPRDGGDLRTCTGNNRTRWSSSSQPLLCSAAPCAIGSRRSRELRGGARSPASLHQIFAPRARSVASLPPSTAVESACRAPPSADPHPVPRSRPPCSSCTARCCCYEEPIITLACEPPPWAWATRLRWTNSHLHSFEVGDRTFGMDGTDLEELTC